MKNFPVDGTPESKLLRKDPMAEVAFPLSDELRKSADEMMEYLENSQDDKLAEKYQIRPGVGVAAPQIGIDAQLSAILIPGPLEVDENGEIIEGQPTPEPFFKGFIVNPKIVSESAARAALETGEGCLSVPEDIEGFVTRAKKITVEYFDLDGNKYQLTLRDYPAIVFQHEIDHLHGKLYYDYINKLEPHKVVDDVTYIK